MKNLRKKFFPHVKSKITFVAFSFFLCGISSLVAEIKNSSSQFQTASKASWNGEASGSDEAASAGFSKNITADEYCSFLNEVAASNFFDLYNSKMGWDHGTFFILRFGSCGSYYYVTAQNKAETSMPYLTFFSATQFLHWLENKNICSSDDSSITEHNTTMLDQKNSTPPLQADGTSFSACCIAESNLDPDLVSNQIFFQITQNSELSAAYHSSSHDKNEAAWKNFGYAFIAVALLGIAYACYEEVSDKPTPSHPRLSPKNEPPEEASILELAKNNFVYGKPRGVTITPQIEDGEKNTRNTTRLLEALKVPKKNNCEENDLQITSPGGWIMLARRTSSILRDPDIDPRSPNILSPESIVSPSNKEREANVFYASQASDQH